MIVYEDADNASAFLEISIRCIHVCDVTLLCQVVLLDLPRNCVQPHLSRPPIYRYFQCQNPKSSISTV